MQTGRNDPCPCGSGEKFKKCCLSAAQASDHEYRRWLNVEQNLIPRLTTHAFSIHDEEAFEEAWCEFNCSDDDEMIQPGSPMYTVFLPWFIFSWLYEIDVVDPDDVDETTNAQSFLEMYKSELSADELTYLEAAMTAEYSLCEVIALKPSEGMTLRDLLTLSEFYVVERLASQSLSRGEIIYCATMELGGVKTNLGTAPYALRPTMKREVIQLRREILEEAGVNKIRDVELILNADEIRAFYLNRVDDMFVPPSLVNSDGDSIVFHELYFDLKSLDDAFRLLKDLSGRGEEELKSNALVEEGRTISIEIPWDAEGEGDVMLGVITLTQGEILARVNSEQRAFALREIIETRLGDSVAYRTTRAISLDDEIEALWKQRLKEEATEYGGSESVQVDPESEIDDDIFGPGGEFDEDEFGDDDDEFGDDPTFEPDSTAYEPNFSVLDFDDAEIQELVKSSVNSSDEKFYENPQFQQLLKEAADKHWSTWFDIPIPALDDMTPRQAAKSEYGRDLLESLLLEYEMNNSRYPDNPSAPNLPHLRRELGMS